MYSKKYRFDDIIFRILWLLYKKEIWNRLKDLNVLQFNY